MNNKGEFSMASWIFGIIFIMVLLIVLSTSVLVPMNEKYGKNFSTGLNTDAFESIRQEVDDASEKTEGAEATQTNEGFSFLETAGVILTMFSVSKDFVTGSFVDSLLVDVIGLPDAVGIGARIIFISSLVFIVVYLIMKVKA